MPARNLAAETFDLGGFDCARDAGITLRIGLRTWGNCNMLWVWAQSVALLSQNPNLTPHHMVLHPLICLHLYSLDPLPLPIHGKHIGELSSSAVRIFLLYICYNDISHYK